MTAREDLLDEAKQYVSKDRNSTYDEPENNFGRIAAIMNAMGYRKGTAELQGHDVALLMMAVKLARLAHTPNHKDSWVDTAGYAACGYDALLAEVRKEEKDQPLVTRNTSPGLRTWTYQEPTYENSRPRMNPLLSEE